MNILKEHTLSKVEKIRLASIERKITTLDTQKKEIEESIRKLNKDRLELKHGIKYGTILKPIYPGKYSKTKRKGYVDYFIFYYPPEHGVETFMTYNNLAIVPVNNNIASKVYKFVDKKILEKYEYIGGMFEGLYEADGKVKYKPSKQYGTNKAKNSNIANKMLKASRTKK